jgi:hypothetical protein
MNFIADIVSAVVDTFIGITAGMGEGVVVLFESLLTNDTGDLTVFGTFAFVVLGLGIATGLLSSLVSLIRKRG